MLGNIQNLKPLIIFGAGASHDLIDTKVEPNFHNNEWRPPLANEIFTNNKFFQKVQLRYPRLNGLIATVRIRMSDESDKKSLEEVLDDIQQDPRDPNRFKGELIALEKYLIELFIQVSQVNSEIPGNNYSAFFRCMDQVCKEYYVVNFNYDYLAQKAIEDGSSIKFDDINSYTNQRIKLIHVHGSILWEQRGDKIVVNKYNVKNIDRGRIIAPTTLGKRFACPDDHVDILRSYIPSVNAIIIIGWQGTEIYFNELWDKIQGFPQIRIVGGGNKDSGIKILVNTGLNRFGGTSVYVRFFSRFLTQYTDFSVKPLANDYF
ncbi:MAG: hypothetical protein ABIC36_01260 [bacterium]